MFLNARLVSVLLSFVLVFVAGCEERVEPEYGGTTFELLRPTAGSNVTDTSSENAKIKLQYRGSGASLSNLYLELNGVDISDEFYMNNVSNVAITQLAGIRSVLVQGDNTLIAGRMVLDEDGFPVLDGNGRPQLESSETFHFNIDDTPPRVTIGSVVASSTNPDGTPASGSTLTVNGSFVDVSLLESLAFTYPGGSISLSPTNNDPVGPNQYNDTTKTFSVVLPNYPDVAAPTPGAHFSYTAIDQFEHRRTERFMASGTPVYASQALQINDTLTANIAPLANAVVENGLILANAANIFGLGKPLRLGSLASPNPGELMENPLTNCQMSADVPGVMECLPVAYGGSTRVFIYPSDATMCSSQLFDSSAGVTHCVVFIKNVDVQKPNLDIDFAGSGNTNDLSMVLELMVGYAGADVEVAGIRVVGPDTYYLGGLKALVSFGEFAIYTQVAMNSDANYLINFDRMGTFQMHLNDLLKVPQVYGSCNICSPLISPFAIVALALGVDVSGNGVPDKKDLINEIEKAIEGRAGPLLDSLLAAVLQGSTKISTNIPVNDKQIIRNNRVVDGHTVYGNNAHFVFSGSDVVDPAYYAPTYSAINGGLGSVFQAQGGYYSNFPFIRGWGITSGGVKNIDLTYAISANSVNQWLLANHQSGMFEEYEMILTGADIAVPGIDVNATDELSLTFNTNEAPSVIFHSEDTTSFSACNGTELCWNPDNARPGSVTLTVNNLDLHLDNNTALAPVVSANVNIEMELVLGVEAGRPSLTLKQDSLRVQVNSFTDPDPSLVTNAGLAYVLAGGMEAFLASPTFNAMFDQQAMTVVISELPGMGGSFDGAGPAGNCNGASVPGEICVQGTQVPYSSLFVGAVPMDFGLLLRRLTIEPTGSYLSFSIDVRNTPVPDPLAPEYAAYLLWQAENYMTLHIAN